VLAHTPEPSRAPNHLPARHDDGAVTAELHAGRPLDRRDRAAWGPVIPKRNISRPCPPPA